VHTSSVYAEALYLGSLSLLRIRTKSDSPKGKNAIYAFSRVLYKWSLLSTMHRAVIKGKMQKKYLWSRES